MTSSPETPVVNEQRRAPRQRAFLRAKISHLDGSITFDCTVTQISATGARIALDHNLNLPERLRLDIPQKQLSKAARLVRREAGACIVAFDESGVQASAAAPARMSEHDLRERVRALEAENRMLRATCESLTAQVERYKANY